MSTATASPEATAKRTALIECEGASVAYGEGELTVHALSEVDLQISEGEYLALSGRSGSGKTTLLHLLGGLIVPSSGAVSWRGEPLSSLDAAARGEARARGIAYVFQGSNLLPHLSVEENMAFAALVSRQQGRDPGELLALVGLGAKAAALPAELSGGEQQRAALARALAQRPDLLLCDEPTGHLDSDTGARVLDLIEALRAELEFAIVIASHDVDVAARADRALTLEGGRIQ